MILISTRIQNFKGIRGPLDVTFAADSPNLLEGPNGAGKSTLVEAVLCGLIENHNTSGTAADQMRPRETALTPSSTVVFEQAGAVYRISKTFLDSPRALLERRRADGSFDAIAKGKAADEQVRDFLRSQGTKSKEKPGERLGIFSVLCSPQGGQELPSLSGNALTDIREMLGAQVSGKGGAAFEKAINKKYSLLWTPGGKPKKGKLTETEAELEEKARPDLERSQEAMRQVAAHEKAALELRSQSQETADRLRTARQESAELAPIAQRVLDLRAQRGPAVSRKDAANARYSQLRAEIDRIIDAGEKKRSYEEKRPQLEQAEKESRLDLEARTGEADAARQAWNAGSQPDPEMQQLEKRVERAIDFLAITRELPGLQNRLERVHVASERRAELETTLTELNAPNAGAWAEIQTASRELNDATLHVEALELRVEIAAERDLAAEIVTGDPSGEAHVPAGQTLTARGDGKLQIRFPGIAILRVSGPSGDAAEWRAKREEKKALLSQLLAPFGAGSWDALVDRVQQREFLSAELMLVNAEYRTALAQDALAGLEERAQELAGRRDAILAVEPSWAVTPPDASLLKQAAEARKSALAREQSRITAEWQAAQGRLADAQRTSALARAAREANDGALASAKADLGRLESDGRSMAERQEDLVGRRRECESAEESLVKLDAELADLPADAPDRFNALGKEITELEAELQRARKEYEDHETAARTLLELGPYTSLATAEERVQQLETDCAAEKLRLDAIRRLKTAVDEAKAKALAGISEPVEERATALLERIAGRPLARIRLGGGMALDSVLPEGCAGSAPVEQMSAGEREQIYFATRLALAEVLAEGWRQVLVLDDPLVNTDAERLPRILELMKEKSDRLQFVILSCHPERYLELPGIASRHMDKLEPSPASTSEVGA